MDWTLWIGKDVKVVLKDGFTKYGRILSGDDNFVEISYAHGPGKEMIAVSAITAIKEVGQ